MSGPDPSGGPGEFLKRGWPVLDRLVAAALHDRVRLDGAAVPAGTVLKKNQAFPAITVERVPGGGRNPDGYQDTARLVVRCWATTKDEADELTAEVRDAMDSLSDDEFAGIELDRVREDTGPGRVADPNPALLAVPTTWFATARHQPQ